jgi:hypothetical protein
MSEIRALGTFQAGNVVDARHVAAAAIALALLTSHICRRETCETGEKEEEEEKKKKKTEPVDGDLGKV